MDCDEDAEVIPPSDAKVILLEAFVLPLEAFIHLTQYGTLKMIEDQIGSSTMKMVVSYIFVL